MRITGGVHRSRIIAVPPGRDIRPTADRVRLAIFNALLARGYPDGAVVLDGFCGSGALGLEALSRGASCCTFLDKSRESLAVCRRNAQSLKMEDCAKLLQIDVSSPGRRTESIVPADLVFLDPPYHKNLAVPALAGLAAGGWLADSALCVVETEAEFRPDGLPPGFSLDTDKVYGGTRVLFLEYHAEKG